MHEVICVLAGCNGYSYVKQSANNTRDNKLQIVFFLVVVRFVQRRINK